ncbi:MAG: sulfite oxidase [Pseudomonadales bacterium]
MRERGIHELSDDPEQLDAALWGSGRRWSRRAVLGSSIRGVLGAGLAAPALRMFSAGIPYARFLPAGLVPVAFAETAPDSLLADKPGLRLLNDRPLNAETPAQLLDDDVTPAERLFVRNNGVPPVSVDTDTWRLRISGESVINARTFSISELRSGFATHSYRLQLECGGNGRAEFRPRVAGNQWTTGAVGCPEWEGVRLRDVLEACGIRGNAIYVGYGSADTHLSRDPSKAVISRGVPMAKALEDESLIAWAMNGGPIPAVHGAPLRLVCGGWPGSVSGKWLTDLYVRDRVHDGAKMEGSSYRVPCHPVAPGSQVPDSGMCIIESMPVKSLITFPASGVQVPSGQALGIRGHAWAGDLAVRTMDVSIDFGATWQRAELDAPANRLAWQRWRAAVRFPQPGYYEIWARATDDSGRSQPMLVPGWNPKGYLNNATHRIAVQAL